MTTYKIESQEHLSRIIEIEASSVVESIDKVREMYRTEEIFLEVATIWRQRLRRLTHPEDLLHQCNLYMKPTKLPPCKLKA